MDPVWSVLLSVPAARGLAENREGHRDTPFPFRAVGYVCQRCTALSIGSVCVSFARVNHRKSMTQDRAGVGTDEWVANRWHAHPHDPRRSSGTSQDLAGMQPTTAAASASTNISKPCLRPSAIRRSGRFWALFRAKGDVITGINRADPASDKSFSIGPHMMPIAWGREREIRVWRCCSGIVPVGIVLHQSLRRYLAARSTSLGIAGLGTCTSVTSIQCWCGVGGAAPYLGGSLVQCECARVRWRSSTDTRPILVMRVQPE